MRSTNSVRRIVLSVIVLAFLVSPIAAEDIAPPYETYPEALGGFFGPFSGSGLHYQKWLGENGFHVTGGIVYIPFSEADWWFSATTLDYSIGGEFQRRVFGEAFTNWLAGSLYLFAGGMHRGYMPVDLVAEGYEVPDSDPVVWVDPVYALGTFQADLTVGVGIGIELILFRHFSIPLEFGYGATWTMTESDFANAISIGPNVQSGLRYRY